MGGTIAAILRRWFLRDDLADSNYPGHPSALMAERGKLSSWQRAVPNRFTEALLSPLPGLGAAYRLGLKGLLRR